MLTITEHSSWSYAPRTYVNAKQGDVTIAIAVDYSTAGEALTHKAAGSKYLRLPLEESSIANARTLYKRCIAEKVKVINVAGNGIYTLSKHDFTQDQVNKYVYEILSKVYEHYKFDKIISGGQTGIDLAGGIAGVMLGVETHLLLPKGFRQRNQTGKDLNMSVEQVTLQIEDGVKYL